MSKNTLQTLNDEEIGKKIQDLIINFYNKGGKLPLKEELSGKIFNVLNSTLEKRIKESEMLQNTYSFYLQALMVQETNSNPKFKEKILESYDFNLDKRDFPDVNFVIGNEEANKEIMRKINAYSQLVKKDLSVDDEVQHLSELED